MRIPIWLPKRLLIRKLPPIPRQPWASTPETAARAWLAAHVAPQSAALSAFDRVLITQRIQDTAALRGILADTSFDVRQFRWTSEPWWQQIPGVLLTAGLLSLGAPFWFSMLKQLTGLRPVLATKQDT